MWGWKTAMAGVAAAMLSGPALADPAAPPPQAVNADCLWAGVTAPEREALVGTAQSMDEVNQRAQAQLPAFLPRLARGCHLELNDDTGPRVGAALGAKLMEAWSARQLHDRFGVGGAGLTAAWRGMPADLRASIGMTARTGGRPTDDQVRAMVAMTQALGLSTPDGINLVITYCAGRGMFEEAGGTG